MVMRSTIPSKPKISIIVPVYNGENHLKMALSSIINQTFDLNLIEVLLVDDCSTDGTPQIIYEITSKYHNFYSFKTPCHSENCGTPRNIGLKNARGQYIMFLDSDDEYMNTTCEFLYSKIEESKTDVAGGTFYRKTDNDLYIPKIFNQVLIKDFININVHDVPSLLLLPQNVWNKIYTSDFIFNNDLFFKETRIGEDTIFSLDTLFSSKKISYFRYPVYTYHNKIDSVSSLSNNLETKTIYEACRNIEIKKRLFNKKTNLDYFNTRYPSDVRFLLKKYLQLIDIEMSEKEQLRIAIANALNELRKVNLDFFQREEELFLRLIAEKKME